MEGWTECLASCVASASCLTVLCFDFLGCDLGTPSHMMTTVTVKVVVLVTKTSLPVPSQVWCEDAGRDLILAEAPARSLLFILEGYFGNQLPALAVHLVREALMAEDALSGGWPAALSAPPLPSIPDVACDVASQASVVLPGAGRTPRPGSA